MKRFDALTWPLTEAEWKALLIDAGFTVTWTSTAPMALLSPRRVVADEGLLQTLRIIRNVARDRDLRSRIMDMRATFNTYRDHLRGIAFIAEKPTD